MQVQLSWCNHHFELGNCSLEILAIDRGLQLDQSRFDWLQLLVRLKTFSLRHHLILIGNHQNWSEALIVDTVPVSKRQNKRNNHHNISSHKQADLKIRKIQFLPWEYITWQKYLHTKSFVLPELLHLSNIKKVVEE